MDFRKKNLLLKNLAFLFLLLYLGCTKQARTPVSPLDTPAHHYNAGMKLLTAKKYSKAIEEFKLSLQLNPEYSPAYYGMGLSQGFMKNFKSAFKNMNLSRSYAKDDNEESQAYVGLIRLYTMAKSENWLENAIDAFDDAISLNPSNSSAYYYMGLAYKAGYKFAKAGEMFKKVLDINKEFLKEADREWATVQKIQRAMPGTSIAKKIATSNTISRADLAALLIEELKLDKLFAKKKIFNPEYKPPKGIEYKTKTIAKTSEKAIDIKNHLLRSDIESVLNLSIRNLKTYPDHTFKPDEPVSRATFASIVEDILAKITEDESLKTKFIGTPSPFPDVRNDVWYYNAIRVCTSIGIIHAKDIATREFKPLDPISGADALLSIRKLKTELER